MRRKTKYVTDLFCTEVGEEKEDSCEINVVIIMLFCPFHLRNLDRHTDTTKIYYMPLMCQSLSGKGTNGQNEVSTF